MLVCADRGLYAKWLFERIVSLGWHPLLRINAQGWYRQAGQTTYQRLASLVSQAGASWCGQVVCFKENPLDETVTVLTLTDGSYVEYGVFRRGDEARSKLLDGFTVRVDAIFDAQ